MDVQVAEGTPALPEVVAPTDLALIQAGESSQLLLPMQFGMVPSWAKEEKMGLNCLNARSETVEEKPSFKHRLEKGRCVVWAQVYMEWQTLGKHKILHEIGMANGQHIPMAGLWDSWIKPDGSVLRSFTIITAAANEAAATVHNRMPVLLDMADVRYWLDGEVAFKEVQPLLRPWAGAVLKVERVGEPPAQLSLF